MAQTPKAPKSAKTQGAHYAKHMAPATSASSAAPQKSYLALKVTGVICGAILALAVVIYFAGCIFFTGRLWPNTYANGIDLSLMTSAQAREAIDEAAVNTSIRVTGQSIDTVIDGPSAGIKVNSNEAVNLMRSDVNCWEWPLRVLQTHDETSTLSSSYDRETLRNAIASILGPYNAVATDPVDAYISYSDDAKAYIVNPGSTGTKLDVDSVTNNVLAALESGKAAAAITSDDLVKQSVTADDPSLNAAVAEANTYLACSLDLTLNGTLVTTLDATTIKDWVSIGSDLTVTLNTDAISTWVDGVEKSIDNVGKTITYTRPDGKQITVTGGTYGWISDGDAIEQLVTDDVNAGVVATEEVPLKQSAAVYNPGGQDWGTRYIDVDITEQHLRFYDSDGSLLLETDVITGAPYDGRDTPTGVYTVNNKATNVTLIGLPDSSGNPSYETPVTYWMPFIGNSVGLHDATWQPAFGGTMYQDGYGSHGCVNLPYDVAEQIYSLIQVGDVVVTHT